MLEEFDHKILTTIFKGQIKENRQGNDFGGFKGSLEGIWGNPSLAKIQRKTLKKNTKNNKKKLRKTKKKICFTIFSYFSLS